MIGGLDFIGLLFHFGFWWRNLAVTIYVDFCSTLMLKIITPPLQCSSLTLVRL